MVANLVTTTPSRFPPIQPAHLGKMQLLEVIDSDQVIDDRMAKLVEIWTQYDPPAAAVYDVDSLEFDPLKIQAEVAAVFESMVRDRSNQCTRGVTLAFAVSTDLDALATLYPYGCPRLDTDGDGVADEKDDDYRERIWLSPSIWSLSGPGQGTFESYKYWALSAPMPTGEKKIRDASALTRRGTGEVHIPIMSDSTMNETWTKSLDKDTWTLVTGTDPAPTSLQVSAVYEFITAADMARQGLTDIVTVARPKITGTTIDVEVWLFPGVDKDTAMDELADALIELVKGIRYLGCDLTQLSLRGALAQSGVYNVTVKSPTTDLLVGFDGCINVSSITLAYKGIGE